VATLFRSSGGLNARGLVVLLLKKIDDLADSTLASVIKVSVFVQVFLL
jgi:hypothetical protein